MKVLIAEDDPVSRRMLEATLVRWGFGVVVTADGAAALEQLQLGAAPVAILDWMMPHLDGLEVCSQLRSLPNGQSVYVIMLTARGRKEDVIAGLEAGANDYVTKPFDRDELRARLQVGARVVELQASLAERVRELEEALHHVQQLQGILPICCYCKKIRDDANYWQQVERYISSHSQARFTHSVCPDCYESVLKTDLRQVRQRTTPTE